MNRLLRLTVPVLVALLILAAAHAFWTTDTARPDDRTKQPTNLPVPPLAELFKIERGFLKYLPSRLELAKRGDEDQICTLLADINLCANAYYALESQKSERTERILSAERRDKIAKLYLRGDQNQSIAYCRDADLNPLEYHERVALLNAASMSRNPSVRVFAALNWYNHEFPVDRYRKIVVEAMQTGDYRAVILILRSKSDRDDQKKAPVFAPLDRALAYRLMMDLEPAAFTDLPPSAQALLLALPPDKTEAARARAEWIIQNTDIRWQSERSGGPDSLALRQRLDCPALKPQP